ncbi:MAG TPA: hypothetical protein VG125_14545, partial [Pirellulales bacterium]|nr:hypothetical protein [Pirellulales bacterium]
MYALTAVGQATPSARSPEEARRQVGELLSKARQAMKEGNLETADSYVSRAENIPVTFGMMHMGDTPKKVRRDLDRMRGGQAPKKPSDLFAPETKDSPPKQTGSVRDPFAGQAGGFEPKMDRPPADTGMADDPRLIDTPPESDSIGQLDNRAFPAESPFGKRAMTSPPEDDYREAGLPNTGRATSTSSDDLLRDESGKLLYTARRALAVGDVRRATDLLKQAKSLDLQYDYREDSPAKIEAAIQHYAQLAQQGGSPDSEGYRRRKAECLLEQAEGLLAWRDFDEAERLVDSVGRLNVVYGPADVRPDMLRERIAAARRGGAAGRVEPLPPVDQTAAAAGRDRAPAGSDGSPKEQVLRLVSQARDALAAGDLDRAEEIAAQAENLRVPDAAFGPNDDRPWQVLLKIDRLRKEQRKVKQAGAVTPIGTDDKSGSAASQAIYDRDSDRTRNVRAGAQDTVDTASGLDLYQRGEQALRDHDREAALGWFRQAILHRDELDPATQQRLQDHLQFLA